MTNTIAPEVILKPSEVKEVMHLMMAARQPVCVWSHPGCAKSALVDQVAKDEQGELIDWRLSLMDAVDLRGLPKTSKTDTTVWCTPEELPRSGKGILFLDELNRGRTDVQNACLQLVHGRKIGSYELPDGWTVMAACNYESDGGGVNKMPAALAERFIHIYMEPDLDDWCKWAAANGVEPVVIAFLRWRPEFLLKFDRTSKSQPNPRSWEFVSNVVKRNPAKHLRLALIAGAVGREVAIEFVAFLEIFAKCPNIDAILMNPHGSPVPTEASVLYALSAGLARRAEQKNFSRILQYVQRISQEFAVFAVRTAVWRDTTLQATPEFTMWCAANPEALL